MLLSLVYAWQLISAASLLGHWTSVDAERCVASSKKADLFCVTESVVDSEVNESPDKDSSRTSSCFAR